ncbi:MAG: DNA primase [Candidatus Dormibacteria bacterium]
MASSSDVEEVKARLNIVEVIGGYVRLQRAGREYRGLCPFHLERSPSFYVNPEKQLWNCHGCHLGGDLLKFVELIDHTDFRGALEELAKRAGVNLEPPQQLTPQQQRQARLRESSLRLNQMAADFYHEVLLHHQAGLPGREFLADRGVGAQDIDGFHLGYAPQGRRRDNLVRYLISKQATPEEIVAAGLGDSRQGLGDFLRRRIVIPIRDERQRWVGFGGRALGADQPKYLNTRSTAVFDKSRILFGLDRAVPAVSKERRATLMEGYFDVIGAHRIGVGTAVSTSGTALTEVQVRLLRRFADEVVLCFDGDQAGQRAARRAVDLLSGAGMICRLALLPEGVDPDDLSRSDPDRLRMSVGEAAPAFEVLIDQALGDASSQSGSLRQEALRRSMAILAKIPEASLRELYAERVGRRLGIAPARILEDVERGGRQPAPAGGLAPSRSGNSAMGASAHLLGLLVARPELVSEVRDRYQVTRGDFPSTEDGDLYSVLCDSLPGGPDPSTLAANLAERWAAVGDAELPELEEESGGTRLQRALEDCVRTIRIEVAESTIGELQRQMAGLGHHREGSTPALVAEMESMRRRIEKLRRGNGLEA